MTRNNLDDLKLLGAANPVRAEDAVADAEPARTLLERVLATPREAVEPPRRSRRRAGLVALGAAVVGLILAVVVASLGNGSASVVDRAYAAVSKPTLYHVVTRMTTDAPAFIERELDLPRGVEVMESWYDLKRPAYHYVAYELRDGRRIFGMEAAGDPTRETLRMPRGSVPGRAPDVLTGKPREVERFDPTAEFKAAYRSDNVRQQGIVTVAGRRAYRLVIEHDVGPVSDPQFIARSSSSVMLFDAQTLAPIEWVGRVVFEINGRRGTFRGRLRYTTFETLPRTPENLAKLKMTTTG
ncbi:MAG TPA: hypothetical protein VGR11_17180 [Solirubrobacteraceae bacterium]|nr:hypothetical protein [Solirubrobacteraceae bacterium]